MTVQSLYAQTVPTTPRKPVSSSIDRVTVFLRGAQVHRSTRVSLASGNQTFAFEGISPSIDKQSIQVRSGDRVTILSVIHQDNFLKEQAKQTEIGDLQGELETVEQQLLRQRNLLQVCKQEEAMLIKNQDIGGTGVVLKTAELREAVDYQRAKLTENYQRQTDLQTAIARLEKTLAAMNSQLRDLQKESVTTTSDLLVTVSTREPLTAAFEISYLVQSAAWFPAYDVRVKDISSPLYLQFRASVSQQSGEDWKGVKMTLSTGNPTVNGTAPKLDPWQLAFFQPVFNPISGALSGKAAGISVPSQLNEVVVVGYGTDREDSDPWYTDAAKKTRRVKGENPIVTSTGYQPTTTTYEIEEAYTVLNDGKTYTVDIQGYEVKADYEYYAAPKMDPTAYLTAKLTNWQDLNLMPGEASLFFEGTYLGKSRIDPTQSGDTLTLSLGQDKGVVVKRTLMKEYSSRKFLGSNRTESRRYEFLVKNNKQVPVRVTLEDQLPLSTNKDIEIQDEEYKGANLNKETGRLTWNLMVEPKTEAKPVLRYAVKYPREQTLMLD